jgi:hypothetical protein
VPPYHIALGNAQGIESVLRKRALKGRPKAPSIPDVGRRSIHEGTPFQGFNCVRGSMPLTQADWSRRAGL